MATTEDQILLKLVIKGQDPSEIQQLAASTQGELNAKIKFYLDQLQALHHGAADAQTKEIAKMIGDEIALREKALAVAKTISEAKQKEFDKESRAAQKASDDAEKAAKRRATEEEKAYKAQVKAAEDAFNYTMRFAAAREREEAQAAKAAERAAKEIADAQKQAAHEAEQAWHRNMEALANIAITARAVFDIVVAGAQRFKALGDSIDRVTNIYNSLNGSIKEMQEATDGEVSAIDLITTKNRAFEKDLHLTDAQFGIVAAGADAFADSLGVNTKEALDKIIDGLATGKKKLLEHAGVVFDVDKAYEKYAKSIGTSAEKLSEHGKQIAFAQAGLRALDEKLGKSGGVARDFSHEWESVMATLGNQWDQILLKLGKFVLDFERTFTVDIPNLLKIGLAQIKDIADKAIGGRHNYAEQARADYAKEIYQSEGVNMKGVEAAKARLAAGDKSYAIASGGGGGDSIKHLTPEEIARAQKEAEKTFDIMYGRDKKSFDHSGFDHNATMYPQLFQMGMTGSLHDQGDNSEKDDELDKLMGLGKGSKTTQELLEKLEEEVKAKKKAMEDDLKATSEKAGGGIFSRLLFGPDGPDHTYELMDEFEKASVDTMSMVADAAHKMADALGSSMAASIAGDNAKKKSIKDVTHDILESLSAQALSRAIFETAEGLASLALGPIGGASAGAHFAAAAMFGAVGVSAGLAARAVGQSSTSSSSAGSSGSGISSAGGGGFNSPRSSSANDNGTSKQPLTINVSVWPGGEAEAGRAVVKAMAAYTRETGQNITDLTTGKAAA